MYNMEETTDSCYAVFIINLIKSIRINWTITAKPANITKCMNRKVIWSCSVSSWVQKNHGRTRRDTWNQTLTHLLVESWTQTLQNWEMYYPEPTQTRQGRPWQTCLHQTGTDSMDNSYLQVMLWKWNFVSYLMPSPCTWLWCLQSMLPAKKVG